MRKNLVLGAGRGPRLAVLELVKRSSEGISVSELAAELKMSYMGVKAHCLALTDSGYLTTWREPATKGRPRLLYRLADSGEALFVESGDELALGILKEAAGLFGVTAPQKLLTMFFRAQQIRYSQLVKAEDPGDRAKILVRLRDREGRMSVLEQGERWAISESHNPLLALMNSYPEARRMEEHMIGEVIGVVVRRKEEGGKVLFFPL